MSHERPKRNAAYGFTEREVLWDRIGHGRFEQVLADQDTTIHNIHLDSNTYGEFLFVTTSRQAGEQRSALTFFGLGYHEYRDRWLIDDWYWYETTLDIGEENILPKIDTLSIIQQRREQVLGYAAGQIQSERGQLFEMLADLTDDDGTWGEFEDLQDWFSDFDF